MLGDRVFMTLFIYVMSDKILSLTFIINVIQKNHKDYKVLFVQ